ncbi:MAG: hypothetical protein LBE09_05670 [Christensenellaceae bacterium]|jgi:hypothetical protein|nr:hypothetical protein [Christensenellaceae bacterium]
MKKNNRALLLILVVCFALAIITALVACNDAKKVSIEILSDQTPQTESGGYISITFNNNLSDNDNFSYDTVLSSTGITNIEEFKSGVYESVIITRYGHTVKHENVEIKAKKGVATYDIRLFARYSVVDGNKPSYSITNATQLNNINQVANSTIPLAFKLEASFDVIENTYIPEFNHTIDGQLPDGSNATLDNFRISGEDNVGLFGVNNGTIKNITLLRANASGSNNVAVLCGINNGTIDNVTITKSTISGVNFIAPLCGIDNGFIQNVNVSGNSITSSGGYYGSVVGISFSNISYGAFGTRPSFTAAKGVNDSMTPLQILQTGIANWTQLENRAKLLKGDFKVDLTNLLEIAESALRSSNDFLFSVIAGLLHNVYTLSNHTEAKLIYDNTNISEEELGHAIGIINSYLTNDPNNSALAAMFNLPNIDLILNAALITMNIGLKFEDLMDLILDNPLSGAAYYEGDTDYLQFTGADIEDTYVDKSTGQAIATFNQPYYTALVEEEIRKQGKIENIDDVYIAVALKYVEEAKKYLFLGDFIEWDLADPAMFTSQTKTFFDGVYTIKLETNPDKLMEKFLAFINQGLVDIGEAIIEVFGEATSPIGRGTQIKFDFAENAKPVINAQVFDNGYVRYWSLDNFSVNIVIIIEPKLKQLIIDNAKANRMTVDFETVTIGISILKPFTNLYSYSRSDSDTELMKRIFNGEEILLSEALADYRKRGDNEQVTRQ